MNIYKIESAVSPYTSYAEAESMAAALAAWMEQVWAPSIAPDPISITRLDNDRVGVVRQKEAPPSAG